MQGSHVRVVHHRDILCPEKEPVAVCCSSGMIWVGLKEGTIQCYSTYTTLKQFHKLYEFQTKWSEIRSLQYLGGVERLVVIEQKSGVQEEQDVITPDGVLHRVPSTTTRKQSSSSSSRKWKESKKVPTKRCCRVYYIIHHASIKTIVKSTKIPHSRGVSYTFICEKSNTLGLVVGNVLYVWRFFAHQLFPVLLAKIVASDWKEISCACWGRDYLSYASRRSVKVIKFCVKSELLCSGNEEEEEKDKKDESSLKYVFHGFSSIGSDDVTEMRFKSGTLSMLPSPDFSNLPEVKDSCSSNNNNNEKKNGDLRKKKKKRKRGFGKKKKKKEVNMDEKNDDEDIEEEQERNNNEEEDDDDEEYEHVGKHEIVDHSVFISSQFISSVSNVMFKRMKKSNGEEESPQQLHFYEKAESSKNDNNNNNDNDEILCVISTASGCLAYNLSTKKRVRRTAADCKFSYTGTCHGSAANSLLLFGITRAGLEIRSVLGSSRGSLLRTYYFFGINQLAASKKYVVLLQKYPEDMNVTVEIAPVMRKKMGKKKVESKVDSKAPRGSFMEHVLTTGDVKLKQQQQQQGRKKSASGASFMEKVKKWTSSSSTQSTSSNSTSSIASKKKKKKEENGGDQKKRNVSTKRKKMVWNVYVLHLVDFFELYDELLRNAAKCQFEKKKLLALFKESHGLLLAYTHMCRETLSQQQQTSHQRKWKTEEIRSVSKISDFQACERMLKESYGLLGDVYMSNKLFSRAAMSYVHSDRTLKDVCSRFSSIDDIEHLLVFLEAVLFNEHVDSQRMVHGVELGDFILEKVYANARRHQLSSVILESWISTYSVGLAKSLLLAEKNNTFQLPKDAFVLALLHLDSMQLEVDNLTRCVDALKSLEPVDLVQLCVENYHLMGFNIENVFIDVDVDFDFLDLKTYASHPSLAVVMRIFVPFSLVEILVRLLKLKKVSLNACVKIINYVADPMRDFVLLVFYMAVLTHFDDDEEDCGESGRCDFVMDMIKVFCSLLKQTEKKLLLERLKKERNFSQFSFIDNFTFSRNVHSWLLQKKKIESIEKISTDDDFKSYILNHFMGVLCLGDQLQINYAEVLKEMESFESKQVWVIETVTLCYANLNQFEKCFVILLENDVKDEIILKFAKFYCQKERFKNWKLLINLLIKNVKEEKDNMKRMKRVLNQVLFHLSKETKEIRRFMELLPEDGNISFFLPCISQAFFNFV